MNKEIMSQELESLIRVLDFIQEEQTFIKRKLSSLLENIVVSDVVIWAEVLHQEILNRETALQLLKNDILIFRNQLKTIKLVGNIIDSNSLSIFKKYKEQVGYIEGEFFTWKQVTNEKFETALN
jgi:hypothetical protein